MELELELIPSLPYPGPPRPGLLHLFVCVWMGLVLLALLHRAPSLSNGSSGVKCPVPSVPCMLQNLSLESFFCDSQNIFSLEKQDEASLSGSLSLGQ